MRDFPLEPELPVQDGPRLRSIGEARDFVRAMVKKRSFNPWKELLRRLEAVGNEEDAVEAAGALREVLELEHMLAPQKRHEHARMRGHDFPLVPELHVRGVPPRVLRSTEDAALFLTELIAQRPDPRWAAVLRKIEIIRSQEEAAEATREVRAILESENLLADAER